MPDLRPYLRGLADLFSFGQLPPRLPWWYYEPDPDTAALRSDWATIGRDFRTAADQLAQELSDDA